MKFSQVFFPVVKAKTKYGGEFLETEGLVRPKLCSKKFYKTVIMSSIKNSEIQKLYLKKQVNSLNPLPGPPSEVTKANLFPQLNNAYYNIMRMLEKK